MIHRATTFHITFCLWQIALTCTQIWWTTEVGIAFSRLEEGYENAIKDYNKKQVNRVLSVYLTVKHWYVQ